MGSPTRQEQDITVTLTRDSVAAGDDVDAPHTASLTLPPKASLADLCAAIAEQNYLAQISGGEATWVLGIEDAPVAVIAQQWQRPLCLVPATTPLAKLFAKGAARAAHVAYKAQTDPVALAGTLGGSGSGA